MLNDTVIELFANPYNNFISLTNTSDIRNKHYFTVKMSRFEYVDPLTKIFVDGIGMQKV